MKNLTIKIIKLIINHYKITKNTHEAFRNRNYSSLSTATVNAFP